MSPIISFITANLSNVPSNCLPERLQHHKSKVTCIISLFFSRKRVKSEMLSLFSINVKQNFLSLISRMTSEMNALTSRSRMKSEMRMPQDRDQEVKFPQKILKILEKQHSRRLLLDPNNYSHRGHSKPILPCFLVV